MKAQNVNGKVMANVFPYSVSYESYGKNDSQYEVSFKDFPYVVGEGKTIEEAIAEAQGNLQAVLDDMAEKGEKIEQPSLHDALKEPSGKITVRMTKTLHYALIKRAEIENMSLNSVIVDAISSYVYHPTFEAPCAQNKVPYQTNPLILTSESIKIVQSQAWDDKYTSSYPADKSRKGA